MKLASALSRRSDLQKRISELQIRLGNNSKVQEGQQPAEDPEALLVELESDCMELEKMIRLINKTNTLTQKDGISLADRLAGRDVLQKKISILRGFLDQASQTVDRYSRTEIAVHPTVDVTALRLQVDRESKKLRELDEEIQSMNWTTELLDEE